MNKATLIRTGTGPFDNGTEYWKICGKVYFSGPRDKEMGRCDDGSPIVKHYHGMARP